MNIVVLGAGAWGTALGITLAAQHQTRLWGRNREHLLEVAHTRVNPHALPGITLPPALEIKTELAEALTGADFVLIATSTAGLSATAHAVHALQPRLPIIWACKGFEKQSGKLPHEIIGALLTDGASTAEKQCARYGVLSGPSFAMEVAKGLPTALTLACNDFTFAQELAAKLSGNPLRVYSNADVIGVELGGALKNVMAIAAGLSDGMQLGMNARAALITRGLAEMVRLGVAMGGKAETFMGLTGLGDLILTATGSLSRNRSVGVALAEGKTLEQILAELGQVAEGVNSAATALALAKQYRVDMPITEAVCALLFENADPRQIVKLLLSRETRAE